MDEAQFANWMEAYGFFDELPDQRKAEEFPRTIARELFKMGYRITTGNNERTHIDG